MTHGTLIKPTHKSLTDYYRTLEETAAQGADHEMAIRRAFRELLATTARIHDWTIIEEQTHAAVDGQSNVRPDATFRDKNTLPRGYWEAKDTADNLDAEIKKKKNKGYSLANSIFEDTRTAVLFQNGQEVQRADLTSPEQLSGLLNAFYAHTEPDFEHWEDAVNDFKDRVPELAKGLVTIIDSAHKSNPKFKKAFTDFFTLCQTALNPNIAQSAVDEMLIQHILTERLFRTIFNAADFTQRNVIAAEVEKVITALASQSFSREEYLKGLDRFYLAIENAAKHLEWTDKQHFLNTIYERFFQGYSVKTADTLGIVYTPQPIVDFMCASVVEVLKKEFKKDLGDPDVFILDPCTGTGNFIVNLLRRIPPKQLRYAYANNLFANEIMLMPYYIAALNIEHAYGQLAGTYEPFEGLCFVDSLDISEHIQSGFDFITQKNSERVERQRRSPITVIIGNPPYNSHQFDEHDNNKNRTYKAVDARIRATYARDSNASLKNKLYDPYVKFFRWATDRLGGRDGVVCYVSNNSFIDQQAFDGMQKHLAKDFQCIYHLDLQGNVRHNPTLSGSQYNVFGIQVGVGITIAIRNAARKASSISYHAVPLDRRRHEKLRWLAQTADIRNVSWTALKPKQDGVWLSPANADEYAGFIAIADKEAKSDESSPETIFRLFSLGVVTSRDDWAYDFTQVGLAGKMKRHITNFNVERARLAQEDVPPTDMDEFVNLDPSFIKWTDRLKEALVSGTVLKMDGSHIRPSLYRPFTHRYLYFDRLLNQRRYQQHRIFPTAQSAAENIAICATGLGAERPFANLATNMLPDLNFFGPGTVPQWYPYYVYDEDGTNRRENITDWSLGQFRTHYKDKKITKWEIFRYVYGILHHPAYRTKFADNLKRELPRIPFAPDFAAFATAGRKLADLHLNYETAKVFPLKEIITEGTPRSARVVSKMKLFKDKSEIAINPSLALAGIPPETYTYKLGNRSALEWIIDQYQVYTDPRTKIASDPNAWGDEHDDPEYLVDLVGRIVTVSLETMKIVNGLPKDFSEAP